MYLRPCALSLTRMNKFLASLSILLASITAYAVDPPPQASVRFAVITDAHIFDAGNKCSGSFVEREYTENLNALRWAVDEINIQASEKAPIDFVVFTGDLGLENLQGAPQAKINSPDADCKDADANAKPGPIQQMDFPGAEALIANIIDRLPQGIKVYFVPGNNDLVGEDMSSHDRYASFVRGLSALTHDRAVDLTGTTELVGGVGGYTLVGLNSSGFKPQKYDNFNEAALATKDPKTGLCIDLPDASAGTRAQFKTQSIETLTSLIKGTGPFLVFTHVPDLPEPLPKRQKNSSQGCNYSSAWLLTATARKEWTEALATGKILGIFTGHFHSPNLSQYGGPLYNPSTGLPAPPSPGNPPTFVAPPLAVKSQWATYPHGARGMMFVSVDRGIISEQTVYYAPGTLLATFSDSTDSSRQKLLKFFSSHPTSAFWVAAIFTLLLICLILFLTSGLIDRHRKSGQLDTPYNPGTLLSKFLTEGDTNTYSLSKLQFVLWTSAYIFSYIYLWFAHGFVQGLPGLPEFATNFPWAILISAATTVFSQASKNTLGTKGGGPLGPQFSDFISAGGSVTPGRLQFFAWTLVAVSAYVTTIFVTDPSTIQVLPDVPVGLLSISGISAGAYLATRAVSPAGPVLKLAKFTAIGAPPPPAGGNAQPQQPAQPAPVPSPQPAAGTIEFTGSYLSPDAVLTLFETSDPKNKSVTSDARVPITTFKFATPLQADPADAEPNNAGFYQRIVASVTDLGSSVTCKYVIRLQNPDGKYAEAELET
jgi:3',5'-cyclic AMP phosphodiesterase CpdA